ncbi:hypothetical protein JMG10_20250 [Nostoc ellipsosporum NOK]|nr:hypothetical protein [Nostoc ellipsosporum NOK]
MQLTETYSTTANESLQQLLYTLFNDVGIFLSEDPVTGELSCVSEKEDSIAEQEQKTALQLWTALLREQGSAERLIDYCQEELYATEQALTLARRQLLEAVRPVETGYRSAALFFENAGEQEVMHAVFLNASLAQLSDADNVSFLQAVNEEFTDKYDRLDLSENYSMLVIPGYLGSTIAVDRWAKAAHASKVMLITDFANLDKPDDVMELFDEAGLTGPDVFRSNVIMTCNWLVGRGRYTLYGEEEHLYIPPSAALAGRLYKTVMSQVVAGRRFGIIHDARGVRFPLRKEEVAGLEKLGLIPLVKEQNQIIAFSARTLFTGDNLGLQTYSVVRVFDYVIKVLMDYLNRKSFENFNSRTRKELNAEIVRFLDNVTGAGKLIENFSIRRFEQDPVRKDRVYLDIHLTPYFPAKTFLLKLEGHKEKEGQEKTEWTSRYQQEAAFA